MQNSRTGETPQPARHFDAVDGLRTVAVLAVIAFHEAPHLVTGGFLGVDVFFVISGFAITLTLLREQERTGRIRLLNFYRRRFWRLAPALVVAILLALLLVLISGHESAATWAIEALLGLTYTYNIGQALTHDGGGIILNHLWSLSVEEQFYLAWAPVLAITLGTGVVRGRRVRTLLVAIAVFAIGT